MEIITELLIYEKILKPSPLFPWNEWLVNKIIQFEIIRFLVPVI